jgi:hypothetical protein
MKKDSSFVLYCIYFKLKNRVIEIELKNHIVLSGKFIGFFRGNTTYISKWHLVDENAFFGIDGFGFLIGQLINHNDISKIKFLEDNSIMNF